MGNVSIAQMARNRLSRHGKDTALSGKAGRLWEGLHVVSVSDVDLSGLSSGGHIDVVFEGADGSTHNQRLWILAYGDKDQYNPAFIELINALFQDTKVYEKLDELVANADIQEFAFSVIRGMRVQIHLKPNKGYSIDRSNDGCFVLVDAQTGQLLAERRFDTVKEARELAVSKGYKRSFPYVDKYKACNDETLVYNRKLFDAAVEGIKKAKDSVSNIRLLFDPRSL